MTAAIGLGGWGGFVAAFAVFLLAHAIPTRPRLRRRFVRAFGERGFIGGYATLSVALLAWLVIAAGEAPYLPLWPYAVWRVWLANCVMPLVCLLVTFALGAPNPLSFGGTGGTFDPSRPGAAGLVRHPLLLAFALWAAVHAIANGDLAHVLLFGGFLAFAIFGVRALDRRRRRQWGDAEWQRLAAATSDWPLVALFQGRWRPRPGWGDALRLALGVALWLALLGLHKLVIGVSPLPPGL